MYVGGVVIGVVGMVVIVTSIAPLDAGVCGAVSVGVRGVVVVVHLVVVGVGGVGEGVGGMQGSAHLLPHVGVGGQLCGEGVLVVVGGCLGVAESGAVCVGAAGV